MRLALLLAVLVLASPAFAWDIDLLLQDNPPPASQDLIDYVAAVNAGSRFGFDGFDVGSGTGDGQNECFAATLSFDPSPSILAAQLVIELTPTRSDILTDQLYFADNQSALSEPELGYGNRLLFDTPIGVRTFVTFDLMAMPGFRGGTEFYDLSWFVSDGQVDLLYCDDALVHSVRIQIDQKAPVAVDSASWGTLKALY